MNPLEALLQQLMQQAGPRGATFAGRVIPQGQTPDLRTLMTQAPTESPDAEGMGGAALAAGPLAKRMISGKTVIPEAVEMPSQPSKWRILNQERDTLVDAARKKGLSDDQLQSLYDKVQEVTFEKKLTGVPVSQEDHHRLIIEGLRNFLATTVR